MALSIDESIRRLKSEILAQDWRLPQRRAEPLAEAFACLKQRFNTRKNVHAILTMADSVLHHLKSRAADPPPQFIDFLKEAMAHVVTTYEDGKFDPEREEALFKRMYAQFALLKQLVQDEKTSPAAEKPATPEDIALPAQAAVSAAVATAAGQPVQDNPAAPPATPPPQTKSRLPQPAAAKDVKISAPEPGTSFRAITIGETALAVAEECIALIAVLRPKKRAAYIKTSHIPLKDFTPFFGGLAKQFYGPLAAIKSRKLKKLELPLMIPRGVGLPTIPDENARFLLVISSGQWHGVLLCSAVPDEIRLLASFKKSNNGDIAGLGLMDDETPLPVLNPETLLEREGFLAAVERNFLSSP